MVFAVASPPLSLRDISPTRGEIGKSRLIRSRPIERIEGGGFVLSREAAPANLPPCGRDVTGGDRGGRGPTLKTIQGGAACIFS